MADPTAHLASLAQVGQYETQSATYKLPNLRLPGIKAPVEVEGDVVGPVGARGQLPVVLFLHGYQASCHRASDGSTTGDWPCKKGFTPIGNRTGFGYLQERLASHGYVTVSIAANGVNVQATDMADDAGAAERAALVHHHLDAWADGSIEEVKQLWPTADASAVMLVGHSRGGEGVDRASAEAPADAPWTIRGEVLMAPTEFARPAVGRVPIVAFSGDCDGDIGPGAGQRYVDRAAAPALLRSSVLLEGANHNFFNTEWDPTTSSIKQGYDDAYLESGEVDASCDPKGSDRLTAAEQQAAAEPVLTVAAAALLSDDSLAADALDGRLALPVEEATVHVAALGRGRSTMMQTTGYTGTGIGGLQARVCRGVSETERPRDCGRGTGMGQSVHWPDASLAKNPKNFLELTWADITPASPAAPAASATPVIPAAQLKLAGPLDLSGATGVEARLALAADSASVGFDVRLTDAANSSVTLPAPQVLEVLPGGPLKPPRRWGLRVFAPLSAAGATNPIDLSRITSIALVPKASGGHAWIIDVSAVPGVVPAPAPTPTPSGS
jgi:dienelactone hydrolase